MTTKKQLPRLNPFASSTFNLTDQGKLLTNEPRVAKRLAKEAGVVIGAPYPRRYHTVDTADDVVGHARAIARCLDALVKQCEDARSALNAINQQVEERLARLDDLPRSRAEYEREIHTLTGDVVAQKVRIESLREDVAERDARITELLLPNPVPAPKPARGLFSWLGRQ